MKLFYLKRSSYFPIYDAAYGFVVRAKNEAQARKLAAEKCGGEGPDVWLSSAAGTECTELTAEGEPGVVLRDYTHE